MAYDGNKEIQEELDRIKVMSAYEKLAYIRNLVKFYKQIEFYTEEAMNSLYDRILLVTKGHDK